MDLSLAKRAGIGRLFIVVVKRIFIVLRFILQFVVPFFVILM